MIRDRLPLDGDVAVRILEAVESLQYGAVEITVHDGRVVQIDRCERYRFGVQPIQRNPAKGCDRNK